MYEPNVNWDTTDTFTYTASDGTGTTIGTVTITITINPSQDAPVAVADTASTSEDGTVTFNVLTNDSDPDTGDSISVTTFNASGTTGTITNNGSGSFTYSPNGKFESLAVGENDAPVTVADTGSTNDNSLVIVDVGANDTDADTSDSLTVTAIANSGSFGATVIVSAGKVKYTAATNTYGDDTVTYTVSDGTTTTNGTLVVTVTDVTKPDNPGYASVQENSPGTDDKVIGTSTDDETVTIQVWDDAGQNNVLIGSQSVAAGGSISIAIGDDQYAEVWVIAIDASGNVNQTAQKLSNTSSPRAAAPVTSGSCGCRHW